MTTDNDWNEIERPFHWPQTPSEWLVDGLLAVFGLLILWAIIVVWFLV